MDWDIYNKLILLVNICPWDGWNTTIKRSLFPWRTIPFIGCGRSLGTMQHIRCHLLTHGEVSRASNNETDCCTQRMRFGTRDKNWDSELALRPANTAKTSMPRRQQSALDSPSNRHLVSAAQSSRDQGERDVVGSPTPLNPTKYTSIWLRVLTNQK